MRLPGTLIHRKNTINIKYILTCELEIQKNTCPELPTGIIFREITNNAIYLSRFQKHNYDLLYTQSLFPILPHITKARC